MKMTGYADVQAIECVELHRLSGFGTRLYHYLKNAVEESARQGRGRSICPRYRVIADDLGCCVRTVVRGMAELVKRGLVVTQRRWRHVTKDKMLQISNRIWVITTSGAAAVRRQLFQRRAERLRDDTAQLEALKDRLMSKWEKEKQGGKPARSDLSKQLEAQGLKNAAPRPDPRRSSDSFDDLKIRVVNNYKLGRVLRRQTYDELMQKGLRRKE
jgi:DNA-binding transcriptional MocR family regulator